jgi:hypothetical protein
MPLSLTQTATVRIVANQAITNNLLRLLALSPSVSLSGSIAAADIGAGAVTPAATSPGAYFYGALTGTNAYSVTLSPALTAYANGVELLGKVGNSNTDAATATLDVNGLGAKNIYHRSGLAPKAGDLVANDIVRFRYNTSRNAGAGGFDILEVLPSAVIRPATNVTTGTANAQAVVNTPPLTAYAAGLLLLVKAGASLTNTGALTLNCDALGTRDVKRQDGSALLSQDWVAGQTYLIYDDGTQFILLGRRADVAVAAATRKLELYNPNLTTIIVSADEVVLKTTDGQSILHTAVSLTVDVNAGVGLNGLETGATRTTSTWYYLWLISDGTNVRGVLETAGTGDGAVPGGPDLSNAAFDGYIYRGLIGHVRLNATGSGEIVPFRQFDRQVWTVEQVVLNAKAATGANAWEILAGADLTAFRAAVPPDACDCSGFAGSDNATDTASLMICGTNAAGGLDVSWHLGAQLLNLAAVAAFASVTDPGPVNSWGAVASFSAPVRGGTARNIEWKSRLTTLTVSLSISGYTF